ncbi:Trehalose-phosphatase [Penicillium verrucosum]|uniref:Trehalose-phosphatase n=1 Tax=Penicillium verrucosum TaxID=60171 RepID=UPI002544D7E1|nr:Trehalose-phosphatase [Penicillium verrucosum]KAJ5944352.1 Trehalose-phosphatase [Penicillium verrucosum]
MERLFRQVNNLGLIAENGCFVREPNADTWTHLADKLHVKTLAFLKTKAAQLTTCEQPIFTFTSLAQSTVTCYAELGNAYPKLRARLHPVTVSTASCAVHGYRHTSNGVSIVTITSDSDVEADAKPSRMRPNNRYIAMIPRQLSLKTKL